MSVMIKISQPHKCERCGKLFYGKSFFVIVRESDDNNAICTECRLIEKIAESEIPEDDKQYGISIIRNSKPQWIVDDGDYDNLLVMPVHDDNGVKWLYCAQNRKMYPTYARVDNPLPVWTEVHLLNIKMSFIKKEWFDLEVLKNMTDEELLFRYEEVIKVDFFGKLLSESIGHVCYESDDSADSVDVEMDDDSIDVDTDDDSIDFESNKVWCPECHSLFNAVLMNENLNIRCPECGKLMLFVPNKE